MHGNHENGDRPYRRFGGYLLNPEKDLWEEARKAFGKREGIRDPSMGMLLSRIIVNAQHDHRSFLKLLRNPTQEAPRSARK